MSFSAVPVFAGAGRGPTRQTLRRTRRWSWMVSGWFEPLELRADGGGTACMTLGCSTDFVAVRLGFPNVACQPWRITRAIARPSDSFNDYVTPTGGAAWTAFNTTNHGSDNAAIVSDPAATSEIEVRGLNSAALTRAAGVMWTWTDWAPIRSQPADPITGLRVLMLRALLPSNQMVTYANGQLRKFTGNPVINRGHDVLIGGLKFNLDLVTEPDRDRTASTRTWIDNQLAPGTLFPMVQFLTQKAGVSGIVAGDSHAQGTSTTEQFSSFMHCAVASLGREYFNSIPFSMTNCAVGGLGSAEFFARSEVLLPALQPSYAVLPGWTFNDRSGTIKADQSAMDAFLSRLLNMVETCEARGILPILLTPFPRNAEAMSPVQLGPWHWLRKQVLGLAESGLVVVDATTILGQQQQGAFTGTYLPSMSDDQMHPNDAGHLAVGMKIAQAIKIHL